MQAQTSTPDQIRETVRQAYGAIATRQANSCCTGPGCCGPAGSTSRQLGYSEDDLASVPDGADLGLGCGNPQAIAALKPGECVLDLGSGAGFDAFLAARQVGSTGRVIGVDMTPEMIARARANQTTIGLANVEFRQGDIEHLPVDAESVDVIMSNCVINLAPDKRAVFREAFRVLAPGGRLAISDIVALGNMPATLADDPAAYTGCVAGAAPITDIERMLAEAGFGDIRITARGDSAALVRDWSPGAERVVASALIEGVKRPAGGTRGRRSPAATPLSATPAASRRTSRPAVASRLTPRRAVVKPVHGRICEHVMAQPADLPWEELHGNLRAFIARRVRNPADVDDLVQRVLLQIVKGLGSLRDLRRLHAWVYRTARNVIVDYYRAAPPRHELLVGSAEDVEATGGAAGQVSAEQEDESTAVAELAQCLQPMLRQLPREYREAVVRTDLDGVAQNIVAKEAGVGVSGMKSRVQRGRRQLKAALEACCRIDLDRRGAIVGYHRRPGRGCGPCGNDCD